MWLDFCQQGVVYNSFAVRENISFHTWVPTAQLGRLFAAHIHWYCSKPRVLSSGSELYEFNRFTV